MVFAYQSAQEKFHSNSYEVNVCRFSAEMQNSEKGERLNVHSLNVDTLLLHFESKQNK